MIKLLPIYTTVISARGTVGNYCLLSKEMTISQSNYGIKAKTGISDYYIFFVVSNMIQKMKQHSYGTVFDTITTKTFNNIKLIIPPVIVIDKFHNIISYLVQEILLLKNESQTLSNVRDTLLPKLMSGKIRVKI